MNCPYYQKHVKGQINCRRGYSKRMRCFTNLEKQGKHIDQKCNGKYRSCEIYQKLENDWGCKDESAKVSV